MELDPKIVHEILVEKGVQAIHHANTVLTACQFLRAGALLSRGTVERGKLFQTSQSSDTLDKKYSLWFDVFTDSVDIHHRAKRNNSYGPVLFVLNPEILNQALTGGVWVTKLNPTKWANTRHEERWFISKKDLKENFVKGRFDQMIVFRHAGGELPFAECLKEIILDDPKATTKVGTDIYSMARGALYLAKTEGGISCKISKRKCPEKCECVTKYSRDTAFRNKVFFPRT